MPYEPISFEDFARRLQSGRYKSLRAARQAIGSSGLPASVRAKGRALAEEHFGEASSEPAAPFDDELEAALCALQRYVAAGKFCPAIKALVLEATDDLRLRIADLSGPAGSFTRARGQLNGSPPPAPGP